MCASSLTCRSLWIFIIILITDEVWNNIGLSNIDQKTVSNDNRALQFCKGSIPLSQILYFVLSIEWVALNEKLSALVVVTAAHHRVHWRLVFARVRIIWIVHWNNEVIHLFFENLLASSIFNVPSCGACSIVALLFVVVSLGSVLYTKVGKTVKFLTSWTSFITLEQLTVKIIILLLWQNT